MAERDQPRDEQELDAPASLVKALNELDRERIFVPPSVDEAVLGKARAHLAQARRMQRHRLRGLPPWAALAASVVLGAWLFHMLPGTKSIYVPGGGPSGHVDIFDAF